MKPAVPLYKSAALLIALALTACGGGGDAAELESAPVASVSTGAGAAAPEPQPVQQAQDAPLRATGATMAYPGPDATEDQVHAWNAQCPTVRCMIIRR